MPTSTAKPPFPRKLVLLGAVVAAAVITYALFGDALTLANLAAQESQLRQFQQNYPAVVYGLTFMIYVTVAALSLPFASALTLLYGWYFGLGPGVILVSFASTTGATLAFLFSRYVFRDTIQDRFGERLASFNRALERDGAFYLFTIRLTPAVPFFVVNLVSGLTPLRARTFWWVSQLGMLPGTILYVYAGSSVPSIQALADDGVNAVFTPRQLVQLIFAFVLLGIFPLLIRLMVKRVSRYIANKQQLGSGDAATADAENCDSEDDERPSESTS